MRAFLIYMTAASAFTLSAAAKPQDGAVQRETQTPTDAAQPYSKAAWMLTPEERIALRTNAELARERVRGGRRVQTSSEPSANPELRPTVDAFDGKTHPELFLPYEVFDQLVKLAFLSSPRTGQVVRDGFMPEVKRHGLPADFWQRLQSVSAVYMADWWAVTDFLAGVRQQSDSARQREEEALRLKHAARLSQSLRRLRRSAERVRA